VVIGGGAGTVETMSVRPQRIRRGLVVFAAALLAGTGLVIAVGPGASPASVGQPADRISNPSGDVAAIYDVEDVDPFVVEATFRVAESSGGAAAAGRTGSLGMRRITRSGSVVHAPPAGYLIPMVYLGLPDAAIGGLIGFDVRSSLSDASVVINELTAQQTGAEVGDTLEMQARNGSLQAFTISQVIPHARIGGTELLLTIGGTVRLGATTDTRTLIWGIDSRQAFDAAAAAEGLTARANTKIDRSWDLPDPDDTLSTARTKQLLGEPWYRILSDGSLEMHPDWKAANLTDGRILLDPTIRVRAQCHLAVVGDLSAALADVAASGLAGQIDVANTNAYGGCFAPRYSRTSGFLSRHTYAMALDLNTTSNCLGCTPRLHCDVVRIFRKHGFAWGGNFRVPDGMHFEWVGQPRDQIPYPSKYCPNLVEPLAQSVPDAGTLGRDVLTIER
jgi:hypothetical protein